ncbi:hypothetical protein R1flu_017176 [Riccia fluitans]|uniref:Peroxidase n=1 Tax=Riccia fluitans TaxID=41844 RepID=A0ABD1XFB0_9MARC
MRKSESNVCYLTDQLLKRATFSCLTAVSACSVELQLRGLSGSKTRSEETLPLHAAHQVNELYLQVGQFPLKDEPGWRNDTRRQCRASVSGRHSDHNGSTVRSAVSNALQSDPRAGAKLLRMFFHDCFVQGCDASVLLDDTATFRGEKTAAPNANSLGGFNVINSVKASLEIACPRTVSCADIVAIAARDGVVLAGGPTWEVEVGRRDSTTASLSEANNLPGPSWTAAQQIRAFQAKGLNTNDLVALSGAHTFGKASCNLFQNRLSSSDPPMDATFRSTLQSSCGTPSATVDLDQGTPVTFDTQYYTNLQMNRGLLTSDQTLASSSQTSRLVNTFTSQSAFFNQFTKSMLKLGRLGVLTGNQGQIRNICGKVN